MPKGILFSKYQSRHMSISGKYNIKTPLYASVMSYKQECYIFCIEHSKCIGSRQV